MPPRVYSTSFLTEYPFPPAAHTHYANRSSLILYSGMQQPRLFVLCVLGQLGLVVGPGHGGADGVLVLALSRVKSAGVARVTLEVLSL